MSETNDSNSDESWECPVENCNYWLPEGMEYLAYDHERLHNIIKQAYIDGYKRSLWELYDRNDEEIGEWAESSFRFRGEYDWWGTEE